MSQQPNQQTFKTMTHNYLTKTASGPDGTPPLTCSWWVCPSKYQLSIISRILTPLSQDKQYIFRTFADIVMSRMCRMTFTSYFRFMRVLVACEESQTVCKAFRELGHEAYSCDLQACSGGHPEWHIEGDAHRLMWDGLYGQPWELMIAHPPCTYLSRVGIRWMDRPGRKEKRNDAIDFFRSLWTGPIKRVCIENPVPMAYVTNYIGKWDQVIQPYFFGDPYMKTTCLWLKNLPKLSGLEEVAMNPKAFKPKPLGYNARGCPQYFTDLVSKRDQAKIRSKTFPGIARAMAEQWGGKQLTAAA